MMSVNENELKQRHRRGNTKRKHTQEKMNKVFIPENQLLHTYMLHSEV